MTTPNNMPGNAYKFRQKILGDLIHTIPTSWTCKSLSKDSDGKEVVESRTVNQHSLRYPLAYNVSTETVERIARNWM
jgi:hypothetical protein